MRFRPSGGVNPNRRPDRAAQEARAEALGAKPSGETLFERGRYQKDIDRAENLAAGLPPEGDQKPERAAAEVAAPGKRDFREPHLETPAQVLEDTGYQPVRGSRRRRARSSKESTG